MLVITGVLLGVVLVVMVGERCRRCSSRAGCRRTLGIALPGWIGLWFAVFPTVEGLVAQAFALALSSWAPTSWPRS